jgi:hypothetical protein
MYWTLGEAAKETGRSKSQLHRAIKSGKLSAVEKTTDGYKLDPSEVFRVFPKVEQVRNTDLERIDTQRDTPETQLYTQKIAFLEEQLNSLQRQLIKSEEREQKEKEEKKHLLHLLDKQGLMLEHLSKKEKLSESEIKKKRRFLWWHW